MKTCVVLAYSAWLAAQRIASPHHASHPMRVILDLDEKSGVLGADFFFAATLCRVSFGIERWMLRWHLSALLRCGQVHRAALPRGSV